MIERAKEINEGEDYNNLIIFAEGTTSNGKGIIDLKKGAFSINTPLKIRGIKYSGRFDPGFTLMESLPSLVGIMCNLKTSLTYYELE